MWPEKHASGLQVGCQLAPTIGASCEATSGCAGVRRRHCRRRSWRLGGIPPTTGKAGVGHRVAVGRLDKLEKGGVAPQAHTMAKIAQFASLGCISIYEFKLAMQQSCAN